MATVPAMKSDRSTGVWVPRSLALAVLVSVLVVAVVHATGRDRRTVPHRAYACARLAPAGLPDYPHTCALIRPHRDGTAELWLQRAGTTYEYCRVSAPYNPPGAYCR